MRGRLIGTQDVIEFRLDFDRHVDGLDRGEVESGPEHSAFSAGPIITADIDDEGVVQFTQVFYLLNDPADLIVGVGDVGSEYFRLVRVDLFLGRTNCFPLREDLRPGSKLSVRRDDTEFLLVGENLVAHFVPAHVELAFHLRDPLFGRMMWCV